MYYERYNGGTNSCAHFSCCMFMFDRNTKTRFLIDTDICLYPRCKIQDICKRIQFKLSEENRTPIVTCDIVYFKRNHDLRRGFLCRDDNIVTTLGAPVVLKSTQLSQNKVQYGDPTGIGASINSLRAAPMHMLPNIITSGGSAKIYVLIHTQLLASKVSPSSTGKAEPTSRSERKIFRQ